MSRSDDQRIEDILEYSDRIASAVALGHQVFLEDEYVSPAVERFIEVLGEASRQISETRKADFPEINWGEIIGLRTRLAHIYHRVDIENIWGAASVDVPNLARILRGN